MGRCNRAGLFWTYRRRLASPPAKPDRIVRRELSRRRVVAPRPHVVEPAAIARYAELPDERERIRNAPRAGKQPPEGQIAVTGDQSAGRIGQTDRRAQRVELVIIRPAWRDLADQPQAVGIAGNQAAGARVLPDQIAQPGRIDQVLGRLAVVDRGDLISQGVVLVDPAIGRRGDARRAGSASCTRNSWCRMRPSSRPGRRWRCTCRSWFRRTT